ncbi:N-acetyltransferase [Bdellovibrio sp. SKB1291214]|uniref:GNAT family N-acetyltransferase n=1 Tax=Bdellovibrio sp. SKB1291214 TaxID=1732569 RepID=UPI0020CFD859|nr:GNAT family N-acetyltransferase [Bdellovibrio sp. SKB1291214]UYL08952.1 N-acetyltransferase [Bdellovibrio sp. SKB1291214]
MKTLKEYIQMNIRHDKGGQRFVTNVQGGDAHILYRRGPNNSYDLYATYVPTESRGQNIADRLVREAVRVAKEDKVQIIDSCPYVASWFKKHPEETRVLSKESGDSIIQVF